MEIFENEQTPLEVNTLTHREPVHVYVVGSCVKTLKCV